MALVVFGMGQHGPDIYFSSIVVNRGDQSNLVSSDIEHRKFTNLVRGWEDGAKLGGICEGAIFHIGVPTGQSRLGIRKFLGEFIEAFSSDDMHKGHAEKVNFNTNAAPR